MALNEGSEPARPEIIQRKRHGFLHKLRIRWTAQRSSLSEEPGRASYEAYLETVRGTFPSRIGEPVILAACDDGYYWKFAITLLHSIEEQGHATQVHLHLCAPPAATFEHARAMIGQLRHVSLSVTSDDARLARGLRYPAVYLASARFLLAAEVLRRVQAPVLSIDVDAIAVRPVSPAFAQLQQAADLSLIQRREETSDSRRVRAGAVGFSPTPAGQRYASAIARTITALFAMRPLYHLDQITLFYVMRAQARRGGLRVQDMPGAFSDFDFSPESVIWMAKGWAMKENGAYAEAKLAVDSRFAAGATEDRLDVSAWDRRIDDE